MLQGVSLFLSFLGGSIIGTNCMRVLQVPVKSWSCSLHGRAAGSEVQGGSQDHQTIHVVQGALGAWPEAALTLRHLASGSKYSTMK